jgi:hypothetical protein
MAVIYLRNSQGGHKVAILEEEAKYDEEHGWTRYNVGTLLTPASAAPVTEYVEDVQELRDLWEKKYGKKPHHKKSADTLRKELGDGNSTNPD